MQRVRGEKQREKKGEHEFPARDCEREKEKQRVRGEKQREEDH